MNEGERIELSIDRRTAELLRGALADLGEHQAAGLPIAPATQSSGSVRRVRP